MLTPDLLERLQRVNDMLTDVEKKIVKKGMALDARLKEELNQQTGEIGDYELEYKASFYSDNRRVPIFEETYSKYGFSGDMKDVSDFSEAEFDSFRAKYYFGFKTNDDFSTGDVFIFTTNHNIFYYCEGHPMQGKHHCWFFHCLYEHTRLGWEDIASIKSVRWEISPIYQYMREVRQRLTPVKLSDGRFVRLDGQQG